MMMAANAAAAARSSAAASSDRRQLSNVHLLLISIDFMHTQAWQYYVLISPVGWYVVSFLPIQRMYLSWTGGRGQIK